jgi:1,2-dihydroxy-3-keto-5-methylthiopentene dioxygenase
MSLLRIYSENDPNRFEEFTTADSIAKALAPVKIRFERWTADRALAQEATQEEILAAYDHSLQRIKREIGAVSADVISVHAETPNVGDIRKKFLNEHTHGEDEARFFVDGSGIFYIHPNSDVYVLLCEKGDFIDIPARTKHWFDMGAKPFLKVIRTFNTPEGWVADFTGSDIASRFPRFEEIALIKA